jgi:hypothetical protein
MPLHEATVYLSMLGVLFGLYKGDTSWGRTLMGVSMVLLIVQLLLFAPRLFPSFF